MKHGWEIKKLGEVCELTMGQSPSSDTYNDSEGLPFFQGNADFGKIHPSIRVYCNAPIRVAEINDILISVRAPIGAINIANCKCCIGRGLASIRNGESVVCEFVYYALLANRDNLIAQGTGSTFKSIGRDILNKLSIPIPPLPIQERIVSELDCINGILEKKREQIKELDALAQSIFYDMFGDPIQNEKGWEVKKLGEVATIGTGSTPSREKEHIYYGGDIHWVKTTEVQNCEIFDTEETITQLAIQQTNCKIYPPDTLLMAMYGQGKTRGQIAKLRISAATNQACAAIQLNEEYSNVDYIYELLHICYEHIRSMAKGCNQANLNLKVVSSIPIPLPPLSLQQAFAAKIEAIEKQKELVKRSIAETKTLLASRMQHYFEA